MPILKKGDLRSCDNWRGTSLLDQDVLGTSHLFTCLVHDRLQVIAELVLSDSQCRVEGLR